MTQKNYLSKQNGTAGVFDPRQFSWREMFSSEQTGKTSIVLFVSAVGSIITAVLLIALVIFCAVSLIESPVVLSLIDSVLTYYGISIGLLGVRSITTSLGGNKVTVSNVTNSDGTRMTTHTIKKREMCGVDSSIFEQQVLDDIPEAVSGN